MCRKRLQSTWLIFLGLIYILGSAECYLTDEYDEDSFTDNENYLRLQEKMEDSPNAENRVVINKREPAFTPYISIGALSNMQQFFENLKENFHSLESLSQEERKALLGKHEQSAGAVVTCPLEVVKTRLQSSQSAFDVRVPVIANLETSNKVTCKTVPSFRRRFNTVATFRNSAQMLSVSNYDGLPKNGKSLGLIRCLRHIVKHEGLPALFRGLGPNLVGVAPSRAIYFCAYSQSKEFFNSVMSPDTAFVHLCSASCAGFIASTATNPIWFVKTRLQLDREGKLGQKMTALECVRRIYRKSGIKGFYKGITASYFGISETVVHFVIYEEIKAHLVAYHCAEQSDSKTFKDFFELMAAAAVSKTTASCIAYPHEVARTRLREEGSKYVSFWQTLSTVFREEGYRGLYRGLSTQLVRQIPNTAIMMSTYEGVVYVLSRYWVEQEIYETEH